MSDLNYRSSEVCGGLNFFRPMISFSSSRSMITNLSAANEFTIDYLNNSENWQYVERAQIFYVPVEVVQTSNNNTIERFFRDILSELV